MGKGAKDSKPAATKASETSEPVHPAPEVKTVRATVDFSELDEAYEHAAIAQNEVINKRGIGIREVLGNLNEIDPPSIADELILSLAVAALGFASAGITTAVAGKMVPNPQNTLSGASLNSALQTAFDDGAKDATTKIAAHLTADSGNSKASFFASQETGLESWRSVYLETLSTKKREAKQQILATDPEAQTARLSDGIRGARDLRAATLATADVARQVQYEKSLAKWMSALAQGGLGSKGGGANLGKAVEMSPKEHFSKPGTGGVIYVAFGQHPASRPFAASGKGIKVAGMTQAARDRIKNTPIRDLDMPIVASGYVYDGLADALSVAMGDNEIAFGRNENGHVWVNGHEDAWAALRKAADMTNVNDAARVILENDIGALTLADARVG
ncbi:MAG TPA: hypothetical protein VK427_20295 [Kofleriaceae bacterium]|nr:hypothetical protein [Kofleriaceae bacterium]